MYKCDQERALNALNQSVVEDMLIPNLVEEAAQKVGRSCAAVDDDDVRIAVPENSAVGESQSNGKETFIPPRGPVAKMVLDAVSPELVVHHLAIKCEQPWIWLLADPEVLMGHDWSPLSPHGLQRHRLPFSMTITLSNFLLVEVCLRSLWPLSLLVAITTIISK